MRGKRQYKTGTDDGTKVVTAKGEPAMPWIYGIQSGRFIKVGVANSISRRLHLMNLYNPHSCKVVVRREHPDAYRVETEAHRILAPYAIGREWFKADPVVVRSAITSAIKEVNKTRRVWKAEPKRTHQDPELARQMTLRMCENVFREMQK